MKTEMEISEVGNEKIATAILQGMEMRVRADKLKKEADELKKEANELLEPLLEAAGANKIMTGVGSIAMYITTRSKLNIAKFKEDLALQGVNVGLIASTELKHTSTSESTSLRFTPRKEG